jgi:hypothetical protein
MPLESFRFTTKPLVHTKDPGMNEGMHLGPWAMEAAAPAKIRRRGRPGKVRRRARGSPAIGLWLKYGSGRLRRRSAAAAGVGGRRSAAPANRTARLGQPAAWGALGAC